MNVKVGFYTQVMGLGNTPKDVTLSSLQSPDGSSNPHNGALCNFWRSAENVQVNSHTIWSVSQASPIRRLQINNNLDLSQRGYSSGGFMADVYTTGTVNSGSQQQWMSRNSHFGRWQGGSWNMVFSGCQGAPQTHCSNRGGGPYTNVQASPMIAEKPYITESGGKYTLNKPHVEHNKVGVTANWQNSEKIDFSHVYVAHEGDSAATITSKLDQGLHVVMQPGNYYLSDSIKVNKANAVVLGIGMATLISNTGKPCIEVGNVEGVRIAGVLLQAGTHKAPTLLKWGSSKNNGNAQNPGVASDVFARVGGRNNPHSGQTSADSMIEINSGNVIVDNTWLWRADHDVTGSVRNS